MGRVENITTEGKRARNCAKVLAIPWYCSPRITWTIRDCFEDPGGFIVHNISLMTLLS
jgi:hypothetical protein